MDRHPVTILRKLAALCVCGGLLAGCDLPRTGPSLSEIEAGSTANGGNVHIVSVDDRVTQASRKNEALGFSSELVNSYATVTDLIRAGDTLSITVWENVDNGLLASVGQKVTLLQEIQVDQSGQIFMPYAGRLLADGKSPEQLRQMITESLDLQTPDPQVEVRRLAGDGSSVTIVGGVGAQGVYPIEPSTKKLTSMIARAGGVVLPPETAQIKIRRGGATSSIWLQDLYDNPRTDIPLRSNDYIIVEEDRRTFTALGATGQQVVPFKIRDLSVAEALAQLGGLNGATADPTGIFIFRMEPPAVANRVLGRSDITTPQRFAYVVDLTKPSGIFLARDFLIRDDDTIYVTEAPFAQFEKVLRATVTTINFAALVQTVTPN
ncbi:polysaccharide export protein [Rhodobacteraceae bacterium KN286]|uniref:Polysaccharide export protein n=2 Tax=Oceanomicrobium pacificus TaxID=2692916 RepID=A0A6B0TRC1_9RHOB|nr:polysaccharide export protein [Oceanomicrobium pacificus]